MAPLHMACINCQERVKDLETAKHQAELARMMQTQLGQQQQAAGGGGGSPAGTAAAGPSSGGAPPPFMQQGFGQSYPPGRQSESSQGGKHAGGCSDDMARYCWDAEGRRASSDVLQGWACPAAWLQCQQQPCSS